MRLGGFFYRLGKLPEALAEYRRAMPIRRRLVDHNPSVISFREGLALCHFELGYMLSLGGMQSEAVPHYRLALAIRQRLADENPNVPRFRQNVAQNHTHLGNVMSLLGKLAEAESELHLAFAILQKQAKGPLAATEVQREMASCLSRLGKIQQRGGRASRAAASFRSAVAIMERLPTPSVRQVYDLACYQSLCDGAAEERGSAQRRPPTASTWAIRRWTPCAGPLHSALVIQRTSG